LIKERTSALKQDANRRSYYSAGGDVVQLPENSEIEKCIAVDVMGGDFGPAVTIKGIDIAIKQLKKDCIPARFILFGDMFAINNELSKYSSVRELSTIVHTNVIVTNCVNPLEALRHKDDSNLGMALNSVACGEAHAVVSAANTGAYITLAKIILGTLPGIDRPAIPALMPNKQGKCIVLDLGANLECSPSRLVQFALMGEVLAKALLKKCNPTVGLLNVGSEEMKGNAVVQETGHILHQIDTKTNKMDEIDRFVFHGFVEGNDIFDGVTDVIVIDGFSGNIALKAIEGSILFLFDLIKNAANASLWSKMVSLLMLPLLKSVKNTIDPRLYNGAVLLGLKKIAVKSHGGADAFGFAQSICVAINMAQSNFASDIEKRLQLIAEVQ
jgi:glycerol-3-phosphate acyltransferase PlsX